MKFDLTLLRNGQKTKQTHYYSILEFACIQLGENPELGKNYDGIENNLLGLRTGKHILFYHVISKQEIEIIRILHEQIDLKKWFE